MTLLYKLQINEPYNKMLNSGDVWLGCLLNLRSRHLSLVYTFWCTYEYWCTPIGLLSILLVPLCNRYTPFWLTFEHWCTHFGTFEHWCTPVGQLSNMLVLLSRNRIWLFNLQMDSRKLIFSAGNLYSLNSFVKQLWLWGIDFQDFCEYIQLKYLFCRFQHICWFLTFIL